VIVALVVSTTLLAMAAFTVDLGNALARRVDLQGIADDAARAGANQLPDEAQARAAAVEVLCSQPVELTAWDYGNCADTPPTMPDAQIDIVDDEGNPSGANFVATHITVTPPPIEVEFSFGQAVGASGAQVASKATARIGTPTGWGVLPFFLTPSDFIAADVPDIDESTSPATVYTPPNGSYQRGVGGTFCMSFGRSTSFGPACPPKPAPPNGPGGSTSEQGELTVPRYGQSGSQIIPNIRQGLEPSVHDWSRWKLAGSIRTPDVYEFDECDGSTTFPPSSSTFEPDVNCLEVIRAGATNNFTERNGFFQSGGRAERVCPGGTDGSISISPNADTTDLFASGTPLIDEDLGSATGGPGSLEDAIRTGATSPVTGWIKSMIFACGRLALLPVLDARIPVGGSIKSYPVLGFAYLWIDEVGLSTVTSSDHGYFFSPAGRLIGLEGFVIPRWYLPEWVANSPTVGPYLGAGWPRQVVLVK
jgi:hypothetical protein